MGENSERQDLSVANNSYSATAEQASYLEADEKNKVSTASAKSVNSVQSINRESFSSMSNESNGHFNIYHTNNFKPGPKFNTAATDSKGKAFHGVENNFGNAVTGNPILGPVPTALSLTPDLANAYLPPIMDSSQSEHWSAKLLEGASINDFMKLFEY